ncbi:MAG: HAD-IG family 5'-nucleotidase [Deltaproteobacteria bacterium]|nr:HAD-IG family 5'-nucleotidase [Deltaproteobacteria bacterium]
MSLELLPGHAALPLPAQRIFCNRTLNLRSIQAIGFDMDYTLVHYHQDQWEGRAYQHCKERLLAKGYPVAHLEFDPELGMLGLILDTENGNLVKANRFGYVKRACHGTRLMEFEAMRKAYDGTVVDLADKRWVFVNTLFGLSESCMYMQLVDLFDEKKLEGVMGYTKVYDLVRQHLDAAHMEGALKAEIMADPDRFVDLDPDLVPALMDLKHAGKKLVVITNSEWFYTKAMMSYCFDRYLGGEGWRSLFHLVIVSARKPAFFSERMPAFEVIDDDGRLVPAPGRLELGKSYLGANARLVEQSLGIPGEDILYVGDHIFADVNASKSLHRWRTGLIVRELERELNALEAFKPTQAELSRLMAQKEEMEHRYSLLRLLAQRLEHGYGERPEGIEVPRVRAEMRELRSELVSLDERITPLAKASGELNHARWGLLLRTGNDKSHLARQIEKHADVYMSRVSNLLHSTPFVYMRSPRGSLPHDSGPEGGV